MASRAAAMAPAFSRTTTFAPFWAAVVAATRPPLPAPTTTMSASTVSTNSVGISGLSRQLVAAAAPVSAVFVPPSAAGGRRAARKAHGGQGTGRGGTGQKSTTGKIGFHCILLKTVRARPSLT